MFAGRRSQSALSALHENGIIWFQISNCLVSWACFFVVHRHFETISAALAGLCIDLREASMAVLPEHGLCMGSTHLGKCTVEATMALLRRKRWQTQVYIKTCICLPEE
jgi:hypothetical protein